MNIAVVLLEQLTALGVQTIPDGDKLRLRPAQAIPPDLLERVRAHKPELLAALAKSALPLTDPASPWPVALPGLGLRTVGPLGTCLLCQTTTWARYNSLPLCLHHALSWTGPRSTPEEARAILSLLLDTWTSLEETRWTEAEVAALKNQILDFWTVWGDRAETWFKAWRAARPEARLGWARQDAGITGNGDRSVGNPSPG